MEKRHTIKLGYRPDIQGLRAIAVGSVVLYHAGVPLHGGFTGVDMFFVISGFVITALLLREREAHGRIRLGRFYVRRILRLAPALAVMTVAVAALAVLILGPFGNQQQAAVTGGSAAVWLSNFVLYRFMANYFTDAAGTNPFLHTWSLGVEEQFYLVYPIFFVLVVLLSRKLKRNTSPVLTIALMVVAALSFLLSAGMIFGFLPPVIPKPDSFAFYGSPTRAWEFIAGALGAVAVSSGRAVAGRWGATFCSSAGVLLIVVAVLFVDSREFPGVKALIPVIGVLLLLVVVRQQGKVQKGLASRPMVWVGDISYSLYLWHWPLLVFAGQLWPGSWWARLAAVLVAIGLSWLSFKFIETPLRGRSSSFNWPFAKVAVPFVVGSLVSSGVLFVGATNAWANSGMKSAASQVNARPVKADECLNDIPVGSRDLAKCTWGAQYPGKPIYLIGDSNAQQFTEGLVEAGRELRRPVTVVAMGGCGLVDLRTSEPQASKTAACAKWVESAHAWLKQAEPGTVILATAGEGIMYPDVSYAHWSGGSWQSTTSGKSKVWATGLESALRQVKAAGHEPLVVRTIPHIPGEGGAQWWNPNSCPAGAWILGGNGCAAVGPMLGQETLRQQPILSAEASALRATGAQSLDLRQELCPGERCSTRSGDRWRFRDGLHITVWQSESLAPRWVTALKG